MNNQWSAYCKNYMLTTPIDNGTGGNLTTDVHLAALRIEYNGVLYTADNDFKRFTPLKWVNPLK